jgi:hypothetical protein
VALDHTAHEGEPDTEAGFRAPWRATSAEEEIEHERKDTGLDAYSTYVL